ncbi:hypothetical protein [Chromobacterium rhizoryzae]|uniref:hypothetical protein n=1 Tax=Chromobacterium rhizoryzae TaxID=1778675 RepID=UPI001D06FD02|nr:hypothetical protein [Chromobacterium rhizoryzae]
MKTIKKTISIDKIDLDTNNPRTNETASQIESINRLLSIENNGEKVYELAFDICSVGSLDPGDSLYVFQPKKEVERYIVLDGNRRVTALRLLSQKQLLEREDLELSRALREKFKRLAASHANRWPQEVDVVVFDSREAANYFIRLRHTGENLGAGRSAWSALQIARFDNTALWQCLSLLREKNLLTLEVLNQLDNSLFQITNLDRIIGTSYFQEKLDVSFNKNTFHYNSKKENSLKTISFIAHDVAIKIVDTRGEYEKIEGIKRYIDRTITRTEKIEQDESTLKSPTQPPPSPPNTSSQKQSTQLGNIDTTGPLDNKPDLDQKNTASSDKTKSNPSEDKVRSKRKRKYLIQKDELTSVSHNKCRVIIDELRNKIPVNDAPYACSMLVRSILEITSSIYLNSFEIKPKADNKSHIITQASGHLIGNNHPTDPFNAKALAKSMQQSSHAYEQLSDTAHSTVSEISPEHVRATWDTIKGGLEMMWKRIHASKRNQDA